MGNERKHGKDGVTVEHSGEIVVSNTGLWTASLKVKFPAGAWEMCPRRNSTHPDAAFLKAESIRIIQAPGLWIALVDYAGISPDNDPSEPVYELSPGVGSEPIETHKDFTTVLAGTAASPKNGAIFVDRKNGGPTTSTNPTDYEFLKFNPPSDLAGVSAFLEPNNTFWVKRWTQKAKPVVSNVMKIDTPDGDCPDFGGSYDWLKFPLSMQGRGGAWTCEQRWMLSGRKGWKSIIYPGT